MSTSTSVTPLIPHIHLLCRDDSDTTAFQNACSEISLTPSITTQITHHNYSLSTLSSSPNAPASFDLIVSPANSYFLLDGAFDDAISRAFSPLQDYYALTRHAQTTLYSRWRGFAPQGTCTIVSIPSEFAQTSRAGRRWGTKWLALCPTMRVPMDVTKGDVEIIYRCIWTLLCEIDQHNREMKAKGDERAVIKSILMTPLATGVGRVSREKWAIQTALAMKHFADAVENAAKWSTFDWKLAEKGSEEVMSTYDM